MDNKKRPTGTLRRHPSIFDACGVLIFVCDVFAILNHTLEAVYVISISIAISGEALLTRLVLDAPCGIALRPTVRYSAGFDMISRIFCRHPAAYSSCAARVYGQCFCFPFCDIPFGELLRSYMVCPLFSSSVIWLPAGSRFDQGIERLKPPV
jgi:hypothetical protein